MKHIEKLTRSEGLVRQCGRRMAMRRVIVGGGDGGDGGRRHVGSAPSGAARARRRRRRTAILIRRSWPTTRPNAKRGVDEMAKLAQEMVDSVFSFGELGFQEVETSKYLTGQLEKYGFKVQRGVAGIPTAWVATWGSGKPVIALGSDIDGIPQASQKPGVAYSRSDLEGAPGHGEGHNTGMPMNIVAAIAVKKIMERDKLPGTIMLWPGVAEEQLGVEGVVRPRRHVQGRRRRAVRARRQQPRRAWGDGGGTGLVSVEYTLRRRDRAQRRRAVARPLGA